MAIYLEEPGTLLKLSLLSRPTFWESGGDRKHKHFLRSFTVSIAWDLFEK